MPRAITKVTASRASVARKDALPTVMTERCGTCAGCPRRTCQSPGVGPWHSFAHQPWIAFSPGRGRRLTRSPIKHLDCQAQAERNCCQAGLPAAGIDLSCAWSQFAAGAERVASDELAALVSQNTRRSSSAWLARSAGCRGGAAVSGSGRLSSTTSPSRSTCPEPIRGSGCPGSKALKKFTRRPAY